MGSPLPGGAVHIWISRPENAHDPELLARYESVLSPSERQRKDRFVFPRHQHLYLVAHALVRDVLSRYGDVAPEDWRFDENEYGRPDIAEDQCDSQLRFNLSHTEGLVACAVTTGRDIGVDVEGLDRNTSFLQVADRYFSAFEVEALHRLPANQHSERFLSYWTLKESYIKARGMGLALPLGQFSFELDHEGPIGIAFGDEIQDQPEDWHFELSCPLPRFLLAVGVRRKPDDPVYVRVEETLPFETH